MCVLAPVPLDLIFCMNQSVWLPMTLAILRLNAKQVKRVSPAVWPNLDAKSSFRSILFPRMKEEIVPTGWSKQYITAIKKRQGTSRSRSMCGGHRAVQIMFVHNLYVNICSGGVLSLLLWKMMMMMMTMMWSSWLKPEKHSPGVLGSLNLL